jgi:hypothetical protein
MRSMTGDYTGEARPDARILSGQKGSGGADGAAFARAHEAVGGWTPRNG